MSNKINTNVIMMYSIGLTSFLHKTCTRSEDANCLPGTVVSHTNYSQMGFICQSYNF